MLDGQQIAVDSKSSERNSGRSLNSSESSAISVEMKPLQNTSWAEEVMQAEFEDSGAQSSHNVSKESLNPNDKNIPRNREIGFQFIENANEEKFERLIKEEKLKTPLKRRHSSTNGSRSNSPNSSNSETDANNGKNEKYKFDIQKDEKRLRYNSFSSTSSSSSSIESDPAVLSRRQKQIDYGKNTIAYSRYLELVPRPTRTRDHPQTPNKHLKYSRRAFDGLIKIWRKQLHHYDPPTNTGKRDNNNQSSSDDSDSD